MVVSSAGIGTAQGCANARVACRCVAYASTYATQRHGSRSKPWDDETMRPVDDSGGLCMSWHTRWNESPARMANPRHIRRLTYGNAHAAQRTVAHRRDIMHDPIVSACHGIRGETNHLIRRRRRTVWSESCMPGHTLRKVSSCESD